MTSPVENMKLKENRKLDRGEKAKKLEDTKVPEKRKIRKEECREERSKGKERVKVVQETVKEDNSEDESDFEVQKGKGTPLKDIPNVVYKLKQQSTSFLALMHGVLYGLHGQEEDFRENIWQFSGFAHYPNEENEKDMIKERLERLTKETLARLCSVFDLEVPRVLSSARKNELVDRLFEFMEAPYVISEDKFSYSEKSSKKRKLQRELNHHARNQSTRTTKSCYKLQGDSAESDENSPKTSLEVTNKEKEDKETDKTKEDELIEGNNKNALNDEYRGMTTENEKEEELTEENKEAEETKGNDKSALDDEQNEMAIDKEKVDQEIEENEVDKETKENDKNSPFDEQKKFTSQKNEESSNTIIGNSKDVRVISVKEEPNLEKFSYKRVAPQDDRSPEEWSDPSYAELKNGICDILGKINLTITTFGEVLEKLDECFEMDLSPRKDAIMVMIEDELYRLADEACDKEDEDEVKKK